MTSVNGLHPSDDAVTYEQLGDIDILILEEQAAGFEEHLKISTLSESFTTTINETDAEITKIVTAAQDEVNRKTKALNERKDVAQKAQQQAMIDYHQNVQARKERIEGLRKAKRGRQK